MDRLNTSAGLMLVSDLDQTMVDHLDSKNLSLHKFNALWESNYRHNSLLVFSSGRVASMYRKLRNQRPLLTPDIAITSVGTEIAYGSSMVPDYGWTEILNYKWDQNIVREEAAKFPDITIQPERKQSLHKISFYAQKNTVMDVTKALRKRLEQRGLDVKMIYSQERYLDLVPQCAGKGQAIVYLQNKLKAEGRQPIITLVCGDSGNDIELFTIPKVYGVLVNNADEDLLKWHAKNTKNNLKIIHASERCAAGIIEAMGHFGLGPNVSPRDIADLTHFSTENVNPNQILVTFCLLNERWRRAEIENSDTFFTNLKEICDLSGVLIDPSGMVNSFNDHIDSMAKCYGDKQGKEFRIWVDQVSTTQIISGIWIIKFYIWNSSGEERKCCVATAILHLKENNWILIHMQKTLVSGTDAGTTI